MNAELFAAVTTWRKDIEKAKYVRVDVHPNGSQRAFPVDPSLMLHIKASYAYNALADFQKEMIP